MHLGAPSRAKRVLCKLIRGILHAKICEKVANLKVVFWNLFISRLKTQSCVNRKISSFLLESSC